MTPTANNNTRNIMHKVLSLSDINASAADLLNAVLIIPG